MLLSDGHKTLHGEFLSVAPAYPDIATSFGTMETNIGAVNPKDEHMTFSLKDTTLTHGYAHGHVHKHNDHLHIHGHIHNHDHSAEVQNQVAGPDYCQELEGFDMCKDIFCDDLDDCFFYECDDSKNLCMDDHGGPACNSPGFIECCEDPDCGESDEACDDPRCLDDHSGTTLHNNSLCDSQRPKMPIFENIIQNVLKGVELRWDEPGTSSPRKRQKVANDFQIHFPHRCHLSPKQQEAEMSLENMPAPEDHHTHQSCFHVKLKPNAVPSKAENQSDFDFFIQFDNFNLLFDEETKLAPSYVEPIQPSYSCKWENCFKKVDDSSLLDHLIEEHVNEEYNNQKEFTPKPYSCEWDDCNFADKQLDSFIHHLHSHKTTDNFSLGPQKYDALTPISTVNSIASPQREPNTINITSMKISPKTSRCEVQPFDPKFTCRWQVGSDSNGEPIMCSRTHDSEGELQHHMQDDHIGLGKPVYQCCWMGCDRNHGKPFIQRQKLLRHIHIHTNYKPCKCHICDARFAVPATLKQHMRTHSGEKPFECNECGKKFTTSSSLSIHHRVHSGERPLECKWPGCGKCFSESSNLAKHMRVHAKSFECEMCGEVFERKTQFTKHRKDHFKKLEHATLPTFANILET